MKYKLKLIYFINVFLFLYEFSFLSLPCATAEVVIIANDKAEIHKMSKSEIKDIFLGREVKWPNGTHIQLVNFFSMSAAPVHTEFSRDYLQKSTSQFSRYWKKMMFLGKGNPPFNVKSETEAIEKVKNIEGAVGYVSSVKPVDGVLVIDITDK